MLLVIEQEALDEVCFLCLVHLLCGNPKKVVLKPRQLGRLTNNLVDAGQAACNAIQLLFDELLLPAYIGSGKDANGMWHSHLRVTKVLLMRFGSHIHIDDVETDRF